METKARQQIEQLVKERNARYRNKTEPRIERSFQIGRVQVHMLTFDGEDGYQRENYVTDYKGELRAFDRVEEIIPEITKGLSIAYELIDNARPLIFGVLAFIVVCAIVYQAIVRIPVENELLALATGLFGYLAGKADTRLSK